MFFVLCTDARSRRRCVSGSLDIHLPAPCDSPSPALTILQLLRLHSHWEFHWNRLKIEPNAGATWDSKGMVGLRGADTSAASLVINKRRPRSDNNNIIKKWSDWWWRCNVFCTEKNSLSNWSNYVWYYLVF